MWKKNFDQSANLSEYIESPETFPKPMFTHEISQPFLIEVDDTPEEDAWDPNIAPKDEWTSEKMTLFLQQSCKQAPPLIEIIEKQDNPYHGNPSFLCTFKAKDGELHIWMLGVCLYHRKEYNAMYESFVAKA